MLDRDQADLEMVRLVGTAINDELDSKDENPVLASTLMKHLKRLGAIDIVSKAEFKPFEKYAGFFTPSLFNFDQRVMP